MFVYLHLNINRVQSTTRTSLVKLNVLLTQEYPGLITPHCVPDSNELPRRYDSNIEVFLFVCLFVCLFVFSTYSSQDFCL